MNLVKKIEEILKNGGIEEYKQEADLIIQEISGLDKAKLLICDDIPNANKIEEIAKKRATSKAPIQHILGYSYFMGEKYIINKNVLIPRDETEILVLKCFELLRNKTEKIHILDIGLGSGCISCALAKKLQDKNIEILGVDISLEALEIAIENINKLDLVRKVIIRKSDLFSKIRDIEKFDLIVSNPPYIPKKEESNLQKEVRDFEPKEALYASDEDGIEFYKKIIATAPNFLKKEGYLAFELGIGQYKKVQELMEKDFKDIKIYKDLAGIERVITGKIK